MSNTVAAWSDRSIITVSGPDAVTYLQGQLSADIARLGVGESTWSLLLAPTGKMIAWLRATRTGETTVLLDLDPQAAADALARLQRFKLRTDADIELVEGAKQLSVRTLDGTELEPAELEPEEQPDGVVVAKIAGVSLGLGGYDLITTDQNAVVVDPEITLDDAAAVAIEAQRIAFGVPRHGTEIDEDVIPGELGQWLIEESVSWTKGCYTGQELVARVDSRGNNTPRHLSVLTFAQDSVKVIFGADVFGADGGVVGTVTSSTEGKALALLKRSVEPGSSVAVEGNEAIVERRYAQR